MRKLPWIACVLCAWVLGSPAASAQSIEGIVTVAVSGEPIANVEVQARCFGCFGASAAARTNASGRYTLRLPATGLYTIHTDAAPDWVNEAHPDATCADARCDRTLGIPEPVELLEETSIVVVDFALEAPARLFLRAFDASSGSTLLMTFGDTRVSMLRDGIDFPLPWEVLPASGAEMRLPAGEYLIAVSNPMYATTRYPDDP